jgi:hypothetical protein
MERIRVNSRSTDWEAPGLSPEAIDFIHKFQASDVLLDHPVELFRLKLKVPVEPDETTDGTEASAGSSNDLSTPLLLTEEPLDEEREGGGGETDSEPAEETVEEVELESPLTLDELDVVLDRFTASGEERLHGRINVNTASPKVLMALPGVDEAKALEIVQARENLSIELKRSPVWLVKENLLDEASFKRMITRITTRSFQYRFQVIGYAVPSGHHRVLEVVIDLATPYPRVLYVRDITKVGLPFPLPTEGQVTNETQENAEI